MSAMGYALAVGQAAIDALTARLNGVDQSLSGKADSSAVSSALSSKADTSMVSQGLAAKANTADLPPIVQCKRLPVSGTAGVVVWDFSPAFDVAPICAVSAETPAGAAYVNVATIVEGATTAAQTQFVVQRVVKTITLPSIATSLLGLVLTLFGFAPAGVYVNCFARRPS